jgi:hypothetical protein
VGHPEPLTVCPLGMKNNGQPASHPSILTAFMGNQLITMCFLLTLNMNQPFVGCMVM